MPVIFSSGGNTRFFWNLDANVGAACPNRQDDVDFVQLAFKCLVENPPAEASAELKAIVASIRPGSTCTGRDDDLLVRAITTRQRDLGLTVDRRVSVMKNLGFYHDRKGSHTYLLIALNNNLVDRLPDAYPRLDRHGLCPGALKGTVLRTLVGKS